MSPDEYQKAWQAHASQTRVTIDADSLLKEVQRNEKELRAALTWSDFAEVGILAVLLPTFIYLGVTINPPWTWYLMVPALIWSVVFRLVVRARRKQLPRESGEPLLSSVKESLALVDHFIWAQRLSFGSNLPMAIAMLVFFAHVCWSASNNSFELLVSTAFFTAFVVAIYTFIYYTNKRVIRTQHEPRRQELLALLTSFSDETTGEVSGEYPILMGTKSILACSPRRMIVAGLSALVLLAIGLGSIVLIQKLVQEYPKLSPFAAVRWQDAQPEVSVSDEWFRLVSLNELPAAEIVAFSQQTYGELWQKRFEEDLVELLTRMGQPPEDTVTLEVQSLNSGETRVLEDVPMTAANRHAIRDAAQERADSAPVPLSELVLDLRKDKQLVGLAAMVMVDGKVLESAADGERKKGSGVKVTISDRWHLGSITKSITSTMIARLVEADKMEWDDTVGECFSTAAMHDEWKAVTLRQLLTHTAGAPANFPKIVALKNPELGPESTAARRAAVLDIIAAKPESKPGTTHAYSNVGFTIAGAMAEKVTGETWDALVKREVFEPLALTSAGFGPPKSGDKKLEQPQGHTSAFGWKFGVGEEADNTTIIGPSGIAHMTLEDLCTYATEHVRGERGEGKLLSAETYKLLHTPELDNYACGWVKNKPSARIPHTHYWHNGSNTMWYALVVFIPDTNMVVAVASNDGDIAHAESAAWDIVRNSAKEVSVGSDPQQDISEAGVAAPLDDDKALRARIAEFLNAANTKAGFSGAVIVARGGQPIYEGAFGFSHLESKSPNTIDTPFRIASLSKQFTAAAIFRLEGQGKLNIDDPVHQYLPEFAESPYRDITIHHLLTHSSGLPRTPEGIMSGLRWDKMSRAETPVDDYVRLAVQMPLNFDPGTDYEYSNFGYRVLAALIARVTGREYADFMEQEVFQPLGMNESGVARVNRPPPESRVAEGLAEEFSLTSFFTASHGRFVNGEEDRNFGTGYGSGGIYTSANDLLKWDRVLAGDAFLAASQKQRYFQPVHGDYACGWIVKKSGLDGRLYHGHSGANQGFFSQMMRIPEDDLVIIAVGNVDATPEIDEVLDRLFRLCRSLPYRDP